MSAVTGPLLLAAPIALAAGAVSFASPCVLPLVPGYLSYVTGMSGAEVGGAAVTRGGGGGALALAGGGSVGVGRAARARGALTSRTVAGALLFVAGFSAVFVLEGSFFGSLGQLLATHQRVLQQVFGGVTIALGLAFSGLLGALPILSREVRPHRLPKAGLLGAPVLGALFGFGWTPCIGPTLAAVQGLAFSQSQATAGRGALLTLFYCAGLGLPFVVVAVAFRQTMGVLAVLRRHTRLVMAFGGLLLVAVGVAELTGSYQTVVNDLQHHLGGYKASL